MRESAKEIRGRIHNCIRGPEPGQAFAELILRENPKGLLRPLMSLIRSEEDAVRYAAAAALGQVADALAETNLEAARDVVRRLMLSLTEESGGIGWGSPEAIGEILARNETLASEFAGILLSYVREEDGNYLEYEPLQRGVLWGLGRLAEARPELLEQIGASGRLRAYLDSDDPTLRAYARHALSLLAP